jgi:hypothetical protein
MRVIMGVIKSKDGVYYLRKKAPAKLEETLSTVLIHSTNPQYSERRGCRGLKGHCVPDPRRANILAEPVLMEFDCVLARHGASKRRVDATARQ